MLKYALAYLAALCSCYGGQLYRKDIVPTNDLNLDAGRKVSISYDGKNGDNSTSSFDYSQYQTYSKIVGELQRINGIRSKVNITLFSIGKTFENRDLWAIKFHTDETEDEGKTKKEKKTIVLDCGAHAREWLAPSTCMYLIDQLSPPNDILLITLKRYDWVIIPLLNPDGYVYTWYNKTTRMWRKNRSYDKEQLKRWNETENALCIGVDINRNFNKHWGGIGAPVNDPCCEMYAGSKPFSERESSALADYLRSMKNDTIAYVSLHCYGQHWMTPWGFTKKRPDEYKEMRRVAQIAVKAMKKFSGVVYSVGPSHDELYPSSGTSTDWAYSTLATPYTYIIEMIPTQKRDSPFEIPARMMVKNAKDIVQGLWNMAMELKEKVIE